MKLTKIPPIAIIALIVTGLALTVTTAAILSANQTVPLSGRFFVVYERLNNKSKSSYHI